jgi:Protein of unknown function (DUF4058)
MSPAQFSDAYVEHLAQGPFAGRIDPWAEDDYFFQQIHSGMIAEILKQINLPLAKLGYSISKEASLQIAEGRKPDVSITRSQQRTKPSRVDYQTSATLKLLEPDLGVSFEEVELDAIYVRDNEKTLVTIIEVVSPGNKTPADYVADYQERRRRLFLDQGVNVVEIDTTRSIKHLFDHTHTRRFAYHTAVFIPADAIYLYLGDFGEALKSIALPLRNEVLGIHLQNAYNVAYRDALIADQIERKTHYLQEALPFPSLLTDEQREGAFKAVSAWQAELAGLREL